MNIAVCDDEQVFVDYFSEVINCYFKDHGMHCSIKKFYFVQDLLKAVSYTHLTLPTT